MRVIVERGAEKDLDLLYMQDEDAAADIDVLLETLDEGPDWLWRITRPEGYRHYGEPQFDVVKFEEFWKKNFNLFRIKPLHVNHAKGYRVLYACNYHTDTIHILAVVNREFKYDAEHQIVKRVVQDYRQLGFDGNC